jgi:hypothetical protein
MKRHEFVKTMMVRLEKSLTEDIKKFIEEAINHNKIDKDHLINKMDILPTVFTLIMKRDVWDLGTCFWIANEVGYPINIEVGRKIVSVIPPGLNYLDMEKE